MGELTVFAYPWDIAADGPRAVVGWAANCGIDRLAVASVYHSADIIAPRRRSAVVTEAAANCHHLPLEAPPQGAWPLASALAQQRPELFAELAAAARASGIGLTGWLVTLHNSSLATTESGLAQVNCFGDAATHALCPSNPAVADYAVALVAAVVGTGYFDEVMVESLNYVPLGHGHPHELWAVRLDPLCRVLASLCFCEHCTAAGANLGLNVGELRRWVADTLHDLWNSPVADFRDADEGLELTAVILARPDLGAWLAMRCRIVTELLARVAVAAREGGAAVVAGGPVFARPLALAWLEGIDVGAQLEHCERMLLMPYYETRTALARDLDHARLFGDPDQFVIAQTLWPRQHGGTPDGLMAKLATAAELGYRRFGLYNYATAPAPAFARIPDIAAWAHGLSPTSADGRGRGV